MGCMPVIDTPEKMLRRRRHKDLIGERFGRWVVVERVNLAGSDIHAYWLCRCDCGTEKVVQGTSLRRGNSGSCGCLTEEIHALQAQRRTQLAEDRARAKVKPTHCTVTNCDKPVRTRGMCRMHYTRVQRHGDPTVVITKKRSRPLRPPEALAYEGIHARLYRKFGSATRCEECGRTGPGCKYDWALRPDVVDARLSPRGNPYSGHMEDYWQLCRPCHRVNDGWRLVVGGNWFGEC